MSSIPTVGIVGCGFIGNAVSHAFKHFTSVKIYDIAKDYGYEYLDVINQDIVFLALPTPMKKDGSVDLSILYEAIEKISKTLPENNSKLVAIKSTIPPGTCKDLQMRFPNLFIVLNPEFLTERTADLDFLQQKRIILGTKSEKEIGAEKIISLYRERFPGIPIVRVHWDEASLIKYFTNAFFCIKVGIFNEMAQVAEALDLDPNKIIAEVLNDGRIARDHCWVPGHDGKKGFGGSCFLKDLNEYINFSEKLGVDAKVGKAVWRKNIEVRTPEYLEKEFSALSGRASSENWNVSDIEIWRPVPHYEGYYSASNTGKIRSEDRVISNRFYESKLLTPGIDSYGYEIVTLCKNSRKTRTVHQLVLETFGREKQTKEETNHKDGNKRNNNINNLEWITNEEHHIITYRQGVMPKGEKVNTSKLTADQVREIRKRSKEGESARGLAREFGVKHSSILKVIKRKSWKHI